MDNTDIRIIKYLAENADISAADIAPDINLSVPAINKRIARMKADGTIRKTTVITDGNAVGKSLSAFILIALSDFSQSESLLDVLKNDPDILECYAVSGEYDYLIKLCARDIDDLEDKLLEMKRVRGLKSQTLMCLREHKYETAMLPE